MVGAADEHLWGWAGWPWKTIVIPGLLYGIIGALLFHVLCNNVFLLKPRRIRRKLKKQGITGPSPSFLVGNIPEMKRIAKNHASATAKPDCADGASDSPVAVRHDWPSSLFPYFEKWISEYGSTFTYSTGNIQLLFTTDLEMVKEITHCKSLALGKPSYLSKDRGALFGQGVLSSNGAIWAHQRKVIAPEFYFDKVKGMVDLMADSATSMLRLWDQKFENGEGIVDIKVDDDLRSLSADMIARACFGSSFSQGKEIFIKIRMLQSFMAKGNVFIGVPGQRYLPTDNNREMWRLEKEISSMILEIVNQHKEKKGINEETILLQKILEGAEKDNLPSGIGRDEFIVDNCKNIYFAGHETTAITVSWCLMLLAINPEWQSRARAEVLEVCGGRPVDADMLRRLKVLTIVIQETLRLYPPAGFVTREVFEDLELRGIQLPKGLNIWIPIPILQRIPDIWGSSNQEFDPERFSEGILGASKNPQAYLPFGVGGRMCLGQHFATVEMKVVLALILQRFSFTISPVYQHSPAFKLVIEPQHGVNLLMEKLKV